MKVDRSEHLHGCMNKESEAIIKIQTAWRRHRVYNQHSQMKPRQDSSSQAPTSLGSSTSPAVERWDDATLHAKLKVRVITGVSVTHRSDINPSFSFNLGSDC
jgi:hypothetical protein